MNVTSIGDLANSLVLRNRSTALKQSIATLTQELTSGRTSDVTTRLGADFSYLHDIERNLSRLQGFKVAAGEAEAMAASVQLNLGHIHDVSASLEATILISGPSRLPAAHGQIQKQARSDLAHIVSALNSSVGGRTLFAGKATDRAPLASADTLLGSLQAEVAGLNSTAAIEAAVDAWFSDPAGFETVMYGGSTASLDPIQVGPGQHVALPFRADDQTFRSVMRNAALAAIATDPAVGLDRSTSEELLSSAAEGLIADQDRLAAMRSDLGFAEARIEEAKTRNAAAVTSLEYARGELLHADPYETATRLEETQFQLESLYAVTVRTSNLSLLSFLR